MNTNHLTQAHYFRVLGEGGRVQGVWANNASNTQLLAFPGGPFVGSCWGEAAVSVAAASPLKARRLGCIGFREGKKECFEGLSPLKPFKWRVRQARYFTGLSGGGGQEGMRRALPP